MYSVCTTKKLMYGIYIFIKWIFYENLDQMHILHIDV